MEALSASPLLDGRFLLLDVLGRGGMASVYRAFDRVEQRLVALKVLARTAAAGPSHPLSTEFEAWSRLRHRNIVRAYELARAGVGPLPRGTPYLVLEHFPGEPAHRGLAAGRETAERLAALARSVLGALAHVHDAGLLHRDLKPGNVLVRATPRGHCRVKLTDFGLAALAGHSGDPGVVSGSIPYVAPEAILGVPLDARADLYGFGILLYYLATGVMPFRACDPRAIIRWHLGGARPDPRESAPRLPDRLARFVSRLIARDRNERPASAAEALALLGAEGPPQPAARRPPRASSERAILRLALDAARAGEIRTVRLPGPRAAARGLLDDLAVQAQIHGLSVHRLARGEGSRRSNLGRLVLRLLLARGGEVRALVARHGLGRGLPLGLLGGLPVWDRMRHGQDAALEEPAARRATAAGVASFLLDSCARQPMVLVVRREALEDPLARDVTAILLGEARARKGDSSRARGGLVLALEGFGDSRWAIRPACAGENAPPLCCVGSRGRQAEREVPRSKGGRRGSGVGAQSNPSSAGHRRWA